MDFTHEQITLSIRELHNAVRALMNADYNTYESYAKSLMYLIQTDPVLHSTLEPFLLRELDIAAIEGKHPRGWRTLVLPVTKEDRIAYGLQVLKRFSDHEHTVIHYSSHFFFNRNITAAFRKTNEQLFTPIFTNIFNLLDDFANRSTSQSTKSTSDHLQHITVENLIAHAPVAIGNGINQTVSYNGMSDKIILALMQNNISITDIDKIRTQIDELTQELTKPNIEVSTISIIFRKICDFGQQLAIPIIASTVNRPEVWQALAEMIK